jgi:hypothetical protein
MNTKMKILSLAIVGLVGFAGSAFAVCPAGPTTAEGGAWTSKVELPDHASSPLAIVPTGLDSSSCHLTSALQAGNTAAASTVRYTHAASEPNYRAQFLVDNTALSAFSDTTESVVLFQAPATTAASGYNRLLRIVLVAGPAGAKRVRFVAQKGAGGPTVGQTFGTDLLPGVNRIEVNLKVGTAGAGSLSYWVNAAAGTQEPAASGTIANLDNTAWGGVAAASLGLTAPTAAWAASHGGQAVGFDTFDSRRNTYIGF